MVAQVSSGKVADLLRTLGRLARRASAERAVANTRFLSKTSTSMYSSEFTKVAAMPPTLTGEVVPREFLGAS